MAPETAPLLDCGAPEGGRAIWLRAGDGVRIRLAHWPAPAKRARHVLILPGRTEYIEKYGLVVSDLATAGWGALVVDWRGQGMADRELPDPLRGHVGDFTEFQRDLDCVLAHAATLSDRPMPWLAHSMGGCIALRGLLRHAADGKAPPAAAFSAPMLGLANPVGQLRALGWVAGLARPFGLDRGYTPTTGPAGLESLPFEGNPLTTDPDQYRRMQEQIAAEPGLGLGGPSLRWMGAALREMAALAGMASPEVPAFFGLGGDEGIVSPAAIQRRVGRWEGVEFAEYPGARHELMMERQEVRGDFLRRALSLFDRHAG